MRILAIPKRVAFAHYLAAGLLTAMAVLMFSSAAKEAITTDEAPHITAGYTYLKFQEYRLNPEHPPLIKDIAALPLLWQNLEFPTDSPSWTENTNDQWSLAPQFLFATKNNPDQIIWWGRLGPTILTVLLGAFIYIWTRKLFGSWGALFALTLYAFSPNILAHGRLVTTDLAAAFAFFIGIWAYLWFLKHQTKRNFFILASVLAIAQLLKFSLVLLWPYFIVITLLWIYFKDKPDSVLAINKKIIRYGLILAGVGVMTLIFIIPVYQFHVLNYAPERQVQDIANILPGADLAPIKNTLSWMATQPPLRALAEYLLGVAMVFLRVGGGNTTYFLGQVASTAWEQYFPVVFALKVPLALLALIVLALYTAGRKIARRKIEILKSNAPLIKKLGDLWTIKDAFIKENFEETAALIFIAFYWLMSISGNLNIGIRHVLPTFPFIYLVLTGQIKRWIQGDLMNPAGYTRKIRALTINFFGRWGKIILAFTLVVLYVVSSLSIYPHFLAYFNELAGGPTNGYKYVVDSNLDWGQDLKNLAKYVEKNNILSIKVAYFGGSDPRYYLGNRFEPYRDSEGPTTGWLAISATFLQGGRAQAVRGYTGSTKHYEWLNAYTPTAVIGHSIFVYDIPE